jgi:hypothetical protein
MKVMHPAFLRTQRDDGSWSFGQGHSGAMGSVIGTALVTLCLEAHYRYTPLYGLGVEPPADGPSGESMNEEALPETPHFRHARNLTMLNSPVDDTAPEVTDHGDFLYFASAREGGLGGSDLYRSRISGPAPGAPENLGRAINSSANESNPALRHAGFHLVFNSDRDDQGNALYSARSKRVVRRYDYSKMPDGSWFARNAGWLIGLCAALVLFVWLVKRALFGWKEAPAPALSDDAPPDPVT